ncbi:MAG: aminotransferase class I/II-fold pyridoxal phosphate-dependent enzyme [bacterium]|nr:aminotransferase class I/II-fold pyridoxal phosphate-dependent enzyme [bacterium]
MNLFNSLGSNYSRNFVTEALISRGTEKDSLQLVDYLNKKYQGESTLVYKGRDALRLGLELLKLPQDSYVAVTGFTCYAVYKTICDANLIPLLLDIESESLNFTSDSLQKAINNKYKIKVVIIQNTLGIPCQIDNIKKVCQENKIYLVEDLAHCIGAKYADETECGSVGDMSILSFSQDKVVDGVSGGALVIRNKNITNRQLSLAQISYNQQLKDRIYPLLTYIIRNTYSLFGIGKIMHYTIKKLDLLSNPMELKTSNKIHKLPCLNSKLVNLQFNELNQYQKHRKSIADIYTNLILKEFLWTSTIVQINNSSNLRFAIFTENRESLIKYLKNNHIHISDTWYDAPIAPKNYIKKTNYKGECPNAEKAAKTILNLPTHINISKTDAENIAFKINQWKNTQ